MKKVNVISSYFLPFTNANAFAIGKKILKLSSDKYNIEVLTYDLEGFFEKSEFWEVRSKNIKKKYLTQMKRGFFKRIIDGIKNGLKMDKADIIISYFHLSELAYLAFLIKRKHKTPWIAIYSDPPTHISPFNNNKINLKQRLVELITSYIPTFLTLKYSDKLIFNDIWQAKYILKEKYEKYQDKIEIIQMGVTIEKENNIKKGNESIILRYLGGLYDPRNAVEFIIAADKFLEKNKKIKEQIKIEFIGDIASEKTKQVYEKIINKENIIFRPLVSYEDSISLMKSADILLVIDAHLTEVQIYPYTPSKILEYIGAKKPILGISMQNSPTHDICIETGNWWSNFEEKNIINSLDKCIKNYLKHEYNENIIKMYSEENKNEQFEKLIDSLIGG